MGWKIKWEELEENGFDFCQEMCRQLPEAGALREVFTGGGGGADSEAVGVCYIWF
jgi:hypothetical protein